MKKIKNDKKLERSLLVESFIGDTNREMSPIYVPEFLDKKIVNNYKLGGKSEKMVE